MGERDPKAGIERAPGASAALEGKTPSVYADLVHLFLELRGRGLSLSAADLELIRAWQERGISAEVIANVMLDMAQQCRSEGRSFPSTFAPVARRVEGFLKRQAEY